VDTVYKEWMEYQKKELKPDRCDNHNFYLLVIDIFNKLWGWSKPV
jgi:hypothetical protein